VRPSLAGHGDIARSRGAHADPSRRGVAEEYLDRLFGAGQEPGCQTFADSPDDVAAVARDALEGWLEAHLVGGQAPPRPTAHARAPRGGKRITVHIDVGLAAAVFLRWARQDAGLSQSQLAERAGVSQQQIAKLENPDENPTLGTLRKVAGALGFELTLDVAARSRFAGARGGMARRKRG